MNEMNRPATPGVCPACGNPDTRVHLTYARDAYRHCDACDLVFLFPPPSPETLRALYADSYDFKLFLMREKAKRKQARRRLARIDRMLRRGRRHTPRILDIGCGHGFYLDEAQRRGWRTLGIETSNGAREYATATLGLTVLSTPLDESPLEPGSMDAASMWHVLEHVTDVAGTLQRVRTALRPGGVLAVACPNIASVSARVTGAQWLWLGHPYHVYQFSPRSLTALLGNNGFEVVKTSTRETFDSGTLVTQLLWHAGTYLARRTGLRIRRKHHTPSQADAEVSIYNPTGFGLSPAVLSAWLLRVVGRLVTILLFPLIWVLWKAGRGTEVEIYAVRKDPGR